MLSNIILTSPEVVKELQQSTSYDERCTWYQQWSCVVLHSYQAKAVNDCVVLDYSLLSPRSGKLRKTLGVYGRLGYNVLSAVSLHYFLCTVRPLQTPVVMQMPLPPAAHVCLSVGCLMYAMFAMLKHPETWSLLGVSQPLGPLPRRPLQAHRDAIDS